MLGSGWIVGDEVHAELDERCYRSLRLIRDFHLQAKFLADVQQGRGRLPRNGLQRYV